MTDGILAALGHRYEIQGLLGEGGNGRVYRAIQLDLKRPVALKILRADGSFGQHQAERFVSEARVTARIHHPNVLVVLDHGVEAGALWIAYELVSGRSLRDVLNDSPLTVPEVILVGSHVAEALAAAHEHGILHRDIKPENIMQISPELYKVIDFGIAKWGGSEIQTEAGLILGTPAYLAPEVLNGNPATVRSDLYSLGVLLHELLAGRPPFGSPDLTTLLHQILSSPPPPLRVIRPGVPAPLVTLIEQLLNKAPEDRPASARAVRHALDSTPGDAADRTLVITVPAGSGAMTTRVHNAAKRHSRIPGLLVALALLIALAANLLLPSKPVEAVTPVRRPGPDSDLKSQVFSHPGDFRPCLALALHYRERNEAATRFWLTEAFRRALPSRGAMEVLIDDMVKNGFELDAFELLSTRTGDSKLAAALLVRCGDDCINAKKAPRALQAYRKAIQFDPKLIMALERFDQLARDTGHWDEVIKMTEPVLVGPNPDPNLALQLGLAYFGRSGDHQNHKQSQKVQADLLRAVPWLDVARRGEKARFNATLYRGLCALLLTGEGPRPAMALFREAHSLAPDRWEPLHHLSVLELDSDQFDLALNHLVEALRLHPNGRPLVQYFWEKYLVGTSFQKDLQRNPAHLEKLKSVLDKGQLEALSQSVELVQPLLGH